jgi:hypothetical protein
VTSGQAIRHRKNWAFRLGSRVPVGLRSVSEQTNPPEWTLAGYWPTFSGPFVTDKSPVVLAALLDTSKLLTQSAPPR